MPDNGILNGQQYHRKSCGTSSINDFGPRQCSVEAPDITGNWTVCVAICLRQQKRKHQTSRLLTLRNNDVIMDAIAPQITSLTIVYSTVYSGADQIKHQSSASLAFVWGIHRWTVNSPHKWPVTRKMFSFDDVIMLSGNHVIGEFTGDRRLPLTKAQ